MRSPPSRRWTGGTGWLSCDVETLKHLARRGMARTRCGPWPRSSPISRHGPRSSATGAPLHWPAAEATLLKFVAHHLWNPAKREAQRKHGMPQNVAESLREDRLLRSEGRHAPATGGCRAGHPAPLARDRGAIRVPCPPAGAAAGGSGVGSSPSSEEAARGYARRAAPVARDLRVGPSGLHARRRDPDCRVSVGRTAVQQGGGAACRAASRRAVRAEASNARWQHRGVMSARWSYSPTPRPAARPETPCPPHRLPPSWCGRAGSQGSAKGAGVPGDRPVGRGHGPGADASVD